MTGTDLPGTDPSLIAIVRTIGRLARSGGSVDILPHVRADGDAAGSSLALAHLVASLGGRPRVVLEESLDWTLASFPGADSIQVGMPRTEGEENADHADAAIMLDCGETTRLGSRAPLFTRAGVRIVLDHHLSSQHTEGLSHIDPSAAAVGEIVYRLVRLLEEETGRALLSHDMAVCMMGAILTDTGGFRFSNTTRDTFEIASDLMSYGLDIGELSYGLLESMTVEKYRLTGVASSLAAFHHDGAVAILGITRQMLADTGADENDTNGLANMLRAIQPVRVALVLKEGEDGTVRVNIRSKDGFNSAGFAALFGGGGHARAAGFHLDGTTMQDAAAMLAEKAGEWLDRA